MIDLELPHFWELFFWASVALACLVLLIISVVNEIMADRRKWRHVPRHMGSVYDATVRTEPRPNIRRA